MDLSETMKQVLAKVSGNPQNLVNSSTNSASMQQQQNDHQPPGIGYVTEKLYMLLQLYLQNKGWNPSIELLQCFSELKDSAMLPSAAYLQVIANRLALDAQGRLVLRDSGKIVLPYEHFANAVMLKHMTGPHGLHLSLEATIRSVIESYTIGRENFGMEKEFIVEVVQSCPNPACRYYKNHLGTGSAFMDAAFQSAVTSQGNVDYMQYGHIGALQAGQAQSTSQPGNAQMVDRNKLEANKQYTSAGLSQLQVPHASSSVQQQRAVAAAAAAAAVNDKHKMNQGHQQITAAIIQQQNRAIAQQNLEKFGNMSTVEKQRVLQQLDKKQYDAPSTNNRPIDRTIPQAHLSPRSPSVSITSSASIDHQQQPQSYKINDFSLKAPPTPAVESSPMVLDMPTNKDLLALHNEAWGQYQPPAVQHQQQSHPVQNLSARENQIGNGVTNHQQIQQPSAQQPIATVGQENIVRVFDELMKNMARMKSFIRPAMCKPYGKQSESLQKTLMDTIQIVQSLRNCIPAPSIPINTWKNEDRHGTCNI